MKIAELNNYNSMAKFKLTEKEEAWCLDKANYLEERFSRLNNIDTISVDPLVSVLDMTNVLREDVNIKPFTRDEILSNAPEANDGYYQVPKTID